MRMRCYYIAFVCKAQVAVIIMLAELSYSLSLPRKRDSTLHGAVRRPSSTTAVKEIVAARLFPHLTIEGRTYIKAQCITTLKNKPYFQHPKPILTEHYRRKMLVSS